MRNWTGAAVLVAAALVSTSLATRAWAGSRPPKLLSLTIDPSSASLIPGNTKALHVTATYADGSTQDLTSHAKYKSTKTSIAAVDATGLVTALAPGDATIIAKDPDSGVSSKPGSAFHVAKLKSLTLTPPGAGVRVGSTVQLKALATFDDDPTSVDVTNLVEWKTTKRSIADVNNVDALGLVRGVATGKAVIRATDPVTGVDSDSASGTVMVVGILKSVAVSPAKRALRIDETTRYHAIGTFERSATADISADVDWAVSNPALVSIDATGKATALALGQATVTATDRVTGIGSHASGADGQLFVVGALASLKVSPKSVVLALHQTAPLKAHGTFAGRTDNFNLTTKVEWTSSNPASVAVDRNGIASCLASGTAIVSARDTLSGVTSTATGGDGQVLCGQTILGIIVSPAHKTVLVGKTQQMRAAFLFPNDLKVDVTRQVTWSSSNPSSVKVNAGGDKGGLVEALAPGTSTIVATDPTSHIDSNGAGGVSGLVTVPAPATP